MHKYGLQGTHHLLPGTGKVSSVLPTRAILKKDKVYAWCSCGYSGNQVLHHWFKISYLNYVEILSLLEELL